LNKKRNCPFGQLPEKWAGVIFEARFFENRLKMVRGREESTMFGRVTARIASGIGFTMLERGIKKRMKSGTKTSGAPTYDRMNAKKL